MKGNEMVGFPASSFNFPGFFVYLRDDKRCGVLILRITYLYRGIPTLIKRFVVCAGKIIDAGNLIFFFEVKSLKNAVETGTNNNQKAPEAV